MTTTAPRTSEKPIVKASAGGDAGIDAGQIWFNGKIVPQEEAKVSVLTHALHYGTSVFEGVRAYKTDRGPAVFRLQEHTQRLFDSAHIMRMPVPYSQDEINQAILDTVRANGWEGCYIRPLIWRGGQDRKSTRLNSSHGYISYAVFCLKKKK